MSRIALPALVALCLLAAGTPALAGSEGSHASAAGPRRILMIQVTPQTTPVLVAEEQAFTATLRVAWPGPVTFHTEYLELMPFDQRAGFETKLADYLASKYAHAQPDL